MFGANQLSKVTAVFEEDRMFNTKITKMFIGTLVLLLIGLTGLSSNASAAPVVIDFEDLPAGTFGTGPQVFVNNQYSDRGITFNNPGAFDYSLGLITIPGFAHSGTKAIEQCSGSEGCTTPIEMRFTAAQTRVKVWVGFSSPVPSTGITVVLRTLNTAGQEVSRATTTLFGAPTISPVRTPLEVTSANANIARAIVQLLFARRQRRFDEWLGCGRCGVRHSRPSPAARNYFGASEFL
jgi:hypothetical protein